MSDARRFQTTRWQVVRAAAEGRDSLSRVAMAELCRIYWTPVYAYIRSRRRDEEAARDLTQGFFVHLISTEGIKLVRRERGTFRSFLLASVRNYLANEWDREQAEKRGGGRRILELDAEEISRSVQVADDETPERAFERQWAQTVLNRVLSRLEREQHEAGRGRIFMALKPYLISEPDETYKDVAGELGMTESAVKVAIHRLRRLFGVLLREEIGETVPDAGAIDSEIRYLFGVRGS